MNPVLFYKLAGSKEKHKIQQLLFNKFGRFDTENTISFCHIKTVEILLRSMNLQIVEPFL